MAKANDKGKPLNKVVGRNANTESKYTWVLDAGHGGLLNDEYQTSGKRSPIWDDGTVYYEGVGNREIARKVAHRLFKLGIHYEFTVKPEDPTDVSLKERVKIANDLPYKDKIGISIHSNGASAESANGWEIYTTPGFTKSDKVAEVFYDRFFANFPDRKFRKDTTDGDSDKEANFYIIKYTAFPFILLENFFHTNEYECKEILMSEEGQNKIVQAIVEAIVLIEDEGV